MGLILDTTVLVDAERKRVRPEELIRTYRSLFGEVDSALSAISIVELTHGIYRSRDSAQVARRSLYVEAVCVVWPIQPVHLEIAKLAGKIEGQMAARGEVLGIEDILIGATALYLNFDVVTLNLKHFQKIPGLTTIQAPALR